MEFEKLPARIKEAAREAVDALGSLASFGALRSKDVLEILKGNYDEQLMPSRETEISKGTEEDGLEIRVYSSSPNEPLLPGIDETEVNYENSKLYFYTEDPLCNHMRVNAGDEQGHRIYFASMLGEDRMQDFVNMDYPREYSRFPDINIVQIQAELYLHPTNLEASFDHMQSYLADQPDSN